MMHEAVIYFCAFSIYNNSVPLTKRDFVYLFSKSTCMKRILMYTAGFLFITISFTSCQKNCKICQQNTYNQSTGDILTTGSDTEYCDASLLRVEATPDVTVLGVTTKWVCR
jgi:hypothetical protein